MISLSFDSVDPPFGNSLCRSGKSAQNLMQHQVILHHFPSNSSHLVQPFHQSSFQRLKIQYGLFAPVKGIFRISELMIRIWMTVQAIIVPHIISNAWSHTRIVVIISSSIWIGCTLDLNRVLSDPTMQTVVGSAVSIIERGRGEEISTGTFDILSEGAKMIWAVQNCPSCSHPLAPRE
jgi:hypothetical protein